MTSGLTIAEVRALPSPILKGVTLGEAANLKTDALIRKQQEQATDSGLVAADARNIEYGAFNITRADGSVLIPLTPQPADPTNFSIKAGTPTYTVINDNVGLQQHLDDIATPVEINFSPDSEKNWIKEAKKYLAQLAGKIYILENTDGYSVKMPDSHIGKASAVKGIRKTHQFKAEVINKFEELFSRVVLLNVEAPSHKENESEARAKRVDASAAFYKFGWPVRINGTLKMFWFGADQFKNANEKELVFYEFGLQDINEKGDSAVRSMHPKAEVKQGTESPSSEVTLGDYLANVKLNPNKDRILPEIIKNTTSEHGTLVPTTATFSIKPAEDTLDRFTVDPLGERIFHHVRTEARLLGDKPPYEQAVNAAQSAVSIIGAVDKFLHPPPANPYPHATAASSRNSAA